MPQSTARKNTEILNHAVNKDQSDLVGRICRTPDKCKRKISVSNRIALWNETAFYNKVSVSTNLGAEVLMQFSSQKC